MAMLSVITRVMNVRNQTVRSRDHGRSGLPSSLETIRITGLHAHVQSG